MIATGQALLYCSEGNIVFGSPAVGAALSTSRLWSRSITQPLHVLWLAGVQVAGVQVADVHVPQVHVPPLELQELCDEFADLPDLLQVPSEVQLICDKFSEMLQVPVPVQLLSEL